MPRSGPSYHLTIMELSGGVTALLRYCMLLHGVRSKVWKEEGHGTWNMELGSSAFSSITSGPSYCDPPYYDAGPAGIE